MKAFEAYLKRARMPDSWVEEVFVSLIRAAGLCVDQDIVKVGLLLRAAEVLPARAKEAFVALMSHYNARRNFDLALLFSLASSPGLPPEGLFVDSDAYTWRWSFEHAITTFYKGREAVALNLFNNLLTTCPEHAKAVVRQNVDLCKMGMSK